MTLLRNDERVFKYWATNVPDICEGGLSQPLLTRLQGTRLFEVNFSSKVNQILVLSLFYAPIQACYYCGIDTTFQLTTTLCEVKYLLSLAGTIIPDAALRLFEHREMLRKCKLTLDALVMKHTRLRTKIASNVIALVSTDLVEVERLLQKGATKLLWSDAGKSTRVWLGLNQGDLNSFAGSRGLRVPGEPETSDSPESQMGN